MKTFLNELSVQRWDDHRLYHHSRINQTLHLVSALGFLVAYAMVPFDPAWAALLAWCLSMVSRQVGHFFFEPRGFDQVNMVSDEYKEAIKVGYNIRRKVVLMSVWLFIPASLWISPSWLGLIQAHTNFQEFAHDVGMGWFALGIGALAFRVVQLGLQQTWLKAFAWLIKILTDPFHDIWLYHKAPWFLLKGEWIDPMPHVRQH